MTLSTLVPWGRSRALEVRREDPFWTLQREMNRLFDDAFGFDLAPWSEHAHGGFAPSVDVHETETEFVVTAEMPGLAEKDFEVRVANGVLTLKGEKRHEADEKGENRHRVERRYGSFRRSLALPAEVDEEKASAAFANGVLTITLPKSEKSRPRVIEVKTRS